MHLRCAQAVAAQNSPPATHPINDPAVSHSLTGQTGDKR